MKSSAIKVGAFYTLRDGTLVRVERASTGGTSNPGFFVWEKDGQEPVFITAREIISEAK